MPVTLKTRTFAGTAAFLMITSACLTTSTTSAQARPTKPTATAAPKQRAGHDVTSAREAKRVDRVKTPKLGWYSCSSGTQKCATTRLPLDYDHPRGKKVEIALLKLPAAKPKKKIGTLFLNPGGPGGSGVDIAANAEAIFPQSVLDRFDVVGFDPRGIANSDQVQCFRSNREQTPVLTKLNIAFPFTKAEEKTYRKGSEQLAKACSSTGKPLSAAMSTAEVARDMDVLRRAVGDKKLNYLGFSYGSYLGQVYANMFPDRFRTLVIDGVLDPVAWAGTKATRNQPVTDRLRSADGAWKALHEILVRCDRAGGTRCSFAPGNPVKNFELIADRLKQQPLVTEDMPEGLSYADFVGSLLGLLYDANGADSIADLLSQLIILTEPPAPAAKAGRSGDTAERRAASVRLAELVAAERSKRRGFDFPYDNSLDAFNAVLCTDSINPAKTSAWSTQAPKSDKRAPYFGRAWLWSSTACASKVWTAKDEDAYRGPFTHRTAAPVLVVGDLWDPATNYAGAVKASKLLPNSRLISSDSWGHTAYGTSACVTEGVDSYLLTGKPAKAKVTHCVGDSQPFSGTGNGDRRARRQNAATPVQEHLRQSAHPGQAQRQR